MKFLLINYRLLQKQLLYHIIRIIYIHYNNQTFRFNFIYMMKTDYLI